jgi:hypothetical protein
VDQQHNRSRSSLDDSRQHLAARYIIRATQPFGPVSSSVPHTRAMKKIFVSYRRAESLYAAGSLSRELRQRFGEDQVFRDRENLGGGVSWKRQVLEGISNDSALLVLIGKNWAAVTDHEGRRRLD